MKLQMELGKKDSADLKLSSHCEFLNWTKLNFLRYFYIVPIGFQFDAFAKIEAEKERVANPDDDELNCEVKGAADKPHCL